MKIKHVHLPECPSTQGVLKKMLEEGGGDDGPTLVSTSRQTGGLGQGGSRWVHFAGSLAFSLSLPPHSRTGLTPLEVGAALTSFFASLGHRISLKWPNDLLNDKGEKCGGILCSLVDADTVVAGIGINWGRGDYTLPRG